MKAEQAFYLNVITNKPFELLCETYKQQKYLNFICRHLNTCNLTFQQSMNSERYVQWGNVEQTEYELEGITDVYTHTHTHTHTHSGPGSVVGIATCYGLDGPGIESRWG